VRVLVVNAGSSSLKLSLLGSGEEPLAAQELAAPRAVVDDDELRAALGTGGLGDADAVGHRIVHGGSRFRSAVVVDESVRRALGELVELAPLHQPKSLAALDAVSAALPGLPAVACFDTAFHATLSDAAATYALPAEWNARWQLRRYGFHGLSHAWIARRAPELVGMAADGLRIVSCHLGAGASLCAIAGGRSVDTTMGFTPLEGLVMATRSGSVDPGLVLWLLDQGDVSEADMGQALEHESGVLGLSGTADMHEVVTRAGAAGGDAAARLALDTYVHRLRGLVGSMAAALGGVDVLAFTGGVGEHSAEIRAAAAAGLGFLGVVIDPARNDAADGDAEISDDRAAARTVVVRAREDLEIASQVRSLLGG
jgi:acetate kinase